MQMESTVHVPLTSASNYLGFINPQTIVHGGKLFTFGSYGWSGEGVDTSWTVIPTSHESLMDSKSNSASESETQAISILQIIC